MLVWDWLRLTVFILLYSTSASQNNNLRNPYAFLNQSKNILECICTLNYINKMTCTYLSSLSILLSLQNTTWKKTTPRCWGINYRKTFYRDLSCPLGALWVPCRHLGEKHLRGGGAKSTEALRSRTDIRQQHNLNVQIIQTLHFRYRGISAYKKKILH